MTIQIITCRKILCEKTTVKIIYYAKKLLAWKTYVPNFVENDSQKLERIKLLLILILYIHVLSHNHNQICSSCD